MSMWYFDSPDFPVHQALPWWKGSARLWHRSPEFHRIPEDLFETREHPGGVVIMGITQDYFSNDGDIIGGNIIIPWMIHGKPVVEINRIVFRGLPITGVRFPNTIVSIWSHAFSECRWLRSVEFLSEHPVFCGHEAFAKTWLSGTIPHLQAIIPDGTVPFPPGCVVRQVSFWDTTSGIDTVIWKTRDVVGHLPIGMAPSTFQDYYPRTGEPPHYSGTSG